LLEAGMQRGDVHSSGLVDVVEGGGYLRQDLPTVDIGPVDIQHEVPKSNLLVFEPAQHDLESRAFLSNKQDPLSSGRKFSDEIGDRLALPGSRGTLDHPVFALENRGHNRLLTRICVENKELLLRGVAVNVPRLDGLAALAQRLLRSEMPRQGGNHVVRRQQLPALLEVLHHCELLE
jgi:hypothetical protein